MIGIASAISIGLGRKGGGYVGLLDLFPNAAVAYSLRKLRAAYSGAAVRVRKEVILVSEEIDIGFDANGNLDTTALLSFASNADGGNVYVSIWYDQTQNDPLNQNNATQFLAVSQPKIVSAGSLVTENGKAAIDFDGAGDSFTTNALAGLTRLDFLYVMQTSDVIYFHFSNTFTYSSYSAHSGSATDCLPRNMGTPTMYINGTQFTGTTRGDVYTAQNGYKVISYIDATTSTWPGFNIGGEGSFRFNGKFQELIGYPSNQSANRTGIETNINDFYSIYP